MTQEQLAQRPARWTTVVQPNAAVLAVLMGQLVTMAWWGCPSQHTRMVVCKVSPRMVVNKVSLRMVANKVSPSLTHHTLWQLQQRLYPSLQGLCTFADSEA